MCRERVIAMTGRPMTLVEFQERFPTDEACRDYLFGVRWPNGFRCPRCGHDHGYRLEGRPLVECGKCGYQASVTAGTIFHRSHVPLRKWFLAIFLVAQEKRGVSALALSKHRGVHYTTAWLMLHKLRRAMGERDSQYLLRGVVEMDDAYFGGVDRGRVGRGTEKTKALVELSVTKRGHPQYAKITVVPDFSQAELTKAAEATVEKGSVIRTDGWGGFGKLGEAGYQHEVIPTKHLPEDVAPFPAVHTLISNAKAGIGGTFHGLGPQ